MWPSIEEAVSKTVLMQLHDMLRDDAILRQNLENYDAFTHMAFDIIVHENGHAFAEVRICGGGGLPGFDLLY